MKWKWEGSQVQYWQNIGSLSFFQELTYFLYFFALSWVLPVLVMTFCYSSIIITIARSASVFICPLYIRAYKKGDVLQFLRCFQKEQVASVALSSLGTSGADTLHCALSNRPKINFRKNSPLQIWAFCKSFFVSVTTAGGDEESKGRNLRSKSSSPDSGRPCKDAHNQGRSLFVFVENQIILRAL